MRMKTFREWMITEDKYPNEKLLSYWIKPTFEPVLNETKKNNKKDKEDGYRDC
jgi:hypothetical protein